MAHGLAGVFISRNNDVSGYWALGKLYGHAQAFGSSTVRADLIESALEPPGPEFAAMLHELREALNRQLASRHMPQEWVKAADIKVTFGGQVSVRGSGEMFECLVTLTSDLGREYPARGMGWCRVHDPEREMKRAVGLPMWS